MKPLPPGACLGVVAPSGPAKPGVLERVAPLIEAMGYRAKLFPGCAGPAHLAHLAATDTQRLADLHAALADPEVHALLALRGGYGCLRLLDGLDRALIAAQRKPLIGYSDLTTLHAVWAQLGIPSWHAPMPASDWVLPGGEPDRLRLAEALRRGVPPGHTEFAPAPHPLNRPGRARGRLLGGNLAVWASSTGLNALPDVRGAILFFEDVSEAPYRVDRYLAQLRLSGQLNAAAGFLLGSFTDAPDGASADAVLSDYLHPLGKPVLAGWPAGHGQPNQPLALGLEVEMDVTGGSLRW